MAIHIVVDGYNIIGSDKGLRGDLEGKRDRLIKQLQQYREKKGHSITVVFDGWRSGGVHEVQQLSGGVTVIFSQQGETADSVIQRLARGLGSGCVVATSDREVRSRVEASGAVAIYATEFTAKLTGRDSASPDNDDEEPPFRGAHSSRTAGKRGNPRKLSKTERRRRETLKKL